MNKYILYFLFTCTTGLDGRVHHNRKNPQNALFDAAWRNDVTGVKEAISQGAKINQCNTFGHTPLMIAAKYNSFEVVELLVNNYKVDINYINNSGMNALALSITNKNPRTLLFLLNKHADPTLITVNGYTLTSLIGQFGQTHIKKAFDEWQQKTNLQKNN